MIKYRCSVCKNKYPSYDEARDCLFSHTVLENEGESTKESPDSTVNPEAGQRTTRSTIRYDPRNGTSKFNR